MPKATLVSGTEPGNIGGAKPESAGESHKEAWPRAGSQPRCNRSQDVQKAASWDVTDSRGCKLLQEGAGAGRKLQEDKLLQEGKKAAAARDYGSHTLRETVKMQSQPRCIESGVVGCYGFAGLQVVAGRRRRGSQVAGR